MQAANIHYHGYFRQQHYTLPVWACIFWRRTPGAVNATSYQRRRRRCLLPTSKRKLDGYEDLNALTVNKAQS
ncbi:hypothetical protein KCP74_12525 [Salmonella enterica subsp. enterica]|nr:hypothetical protein KCP74_12525 [Salmonella enterica subsp. enterica]